MKININNDYGELEVSYLVGVLLGINAISDSYLWIDSPDCFFFKIDFIQGNHDLNSDLRRANGFHRFFATISNIDNVVNDRLDEFITSLKKFVSYEKNNVTFVTSMPMAQLVGYDYKGIVSKLKSFTSKPIINIHSRSMTNCWIDGYDDFLLGIAKNIDLSDSKIEKNNVAIVGNLFDRNEGDCFGNLNEFKKIIEGLGLNLVSIWLNGGCYDDLLKIKSAGTIISLPYGRRAAKKISKRLGSDLIELDLPFGFEGTKKFIYGIAEKFGLIQKADEFIHNELKNNINLKPLKNSLRKTFFNKKIAINSDPYLLNGFLDIAVMLGLNIEHLHCHGDKSHLSNNISGSVSNYNVGYGSFDISCVSDDVDLIISHAHNYHYIRKNKKYKYMEFGFPSYNYHVYNNCPFLGFGGTLNVINRMANEIERISSGLVKKDAYKSI